MSAAFRFGTVGSPIETPKKPGGSVGAIQFSRSIGLHALELGWVRAVRVSEETCQAIQAAALENDVSISVHAPYFINLNADQEEWIKSRQRLMDAAFYGDLAGATDIIFHPGSYFGKSPENVLPVVIERLHGCMEELRSKQIHVTLRPETMGKSAMIGSLQDTLKMAAEVEGVEPCLDFPHLHARAGDGSVNTLQEWQEQLECYAGALGESSLQNLHIHLSGIAYSEKGEKHHLPIEESDLDIRAILLALHQAGAAGRILCESPEMEKDALFIKSLWQEITKTQDM